MWLSCQDSCDGSRAPNRERYRFKGLFGVRGSRSLVVTTVWVAVSISLLRTRPPFVTSSIFKRPSAFRVPRNDVNLKKKREKKRNRLRLLLGTPVNDPEPITRSRADDRDLRRFPGILQITLVKISQS